MCATFAVQHGVLLPLDDDAVRKSIVDAPSGNVAPGADDKDKEPGHEEQREDPAQRLDAGGHPGKRPSEEEQPACRRLPPGEGFSRLGVDDPQVQEALPERRTVQPPERDDIQGRGHGQQQFRPERRQVGKRGGRSVLCHVGVLARRFEPEQRGNGDHDNYQQRHVDQPGARPARHGGWLPDLLGDIGPPHRTSGNRHGWRCSFRVRPFVGSA